MTSAGRHRTGRAGSALPLVYVALALLLVVTLLPTALRPPQQPSTQSAELSPDAPPDDSTESIVAALNRGTSGTAGSGPGEGVAEPGLSGGPPMVRTPPVAARPRGCPSGVGVPPRQVESYYAAPCAAAWEGDNGGATYKGVTSTEVRIANITADGNMKASYTGWVPETEQPNETEQDRTWRVFQAYFNQNFQFYGRRLRIYLNQPSNEEAPTRAAAAEADQVGVFGMLANTTPGLEEAARRELVGMGGFQLPRDLYESNRPYLWSWWMDGTRLAEFTAEYLCKRLVGGRSLHAGGAEQDKPRKFGLLLVRPEDRFGRNGFEDLPEMLDATCGVDIVVVAYGLGTDSENASSHSTGISRFRLAGVTTVVAATDPIFIGPFLRQADAQGYYPEWFSTGMWLLDHPFVPKLLGYSQSQWSHAFGLTPNKVWLPNPRMDWYRAYKSIDPASEPHREAEQVFPHLLQMANGIQMAGPRLTPQTFEDGLMQMGYRDNEPFYTLAGGYGPGDYSYSEVVAEEWWSPSDVGYDGLAGTYHLLGCGTRYRRGEIPTGEPAGMFRDPCPYPVGDDMS